VCAQRDPKGLYGRASTGTLSSLTGVDDPYEVPTAPELVVGGDAAVEDTVDAVLACLARVEGDAPSP
jgi:adenylylsulfate kinase-like enzyme